MTRTYPRLAGRRQIRYVSIGGLVVAAGLLLSAARAPARADIVFTTANLVSDGFVPAANIDPNLVNPWGIALGPTSPFWVSDNGTGVATVYNSGGSTVIPPVTIPAVQAGAAGSPTGQVFNPGSGFDVSSGSVSGAAKFMFATEDGTISGWAPNVNFGKAIIAVNNSASHAVYKGLAIASSNNQLLLYAANFWSGKIEVYNQNFQLVNAFTDPTIPTGYAPFNVQAFGGRLYVTYAKQDATKQNEVDGAGLGYVDSFNLDGTGVMRIASNGALNAPWGLDIAPASFGRFAGDLLVGNFGNGWIDAFNPSTNAADGLLSNANGDPLTIDGLWGLITGNGASGGSASDVYFAAGLGNEQHGLFGAIEPVPEPWTVILLMPATFGLMLLHRRTRTARI